MQQVTLSQVKAKHAAMAAMHAEIGSLIEKLENAPAPSKVRCQAVEIELQPGEWYAGAVLKEDGSVQHHLVVAARADEELDFEAAQTWASSLGLSAPTRQETRLIVAHQHGRLDGLGWIWTCERYEGNSAYAWHCDLSDGDVNYDGRSASGGAVAVRRIIP